MVHAARRRDDGRLARAQLSDVRHAVPAVDRPVIRRLPAGVHEKIFEDLVAAAEPAAGSCDQLPIAGLSQGGHHPVIGRQSGAPVVEIQRGSRPVEEYVAAQASRRAHRLEPQRRLLLPDADLAAEIARDLDAARLLARPPVGADFPWHSDATVRVEVPKVRAGKSE